MKNKINWVKVMEDNREAIEDAIKLAKAESYNTMQGWHVDVEINEQGEAWTGGLASQGSQSMSSYNGETFIVTHVESWQVEINELESIRNDKKLYSEYKAQMDNDDGYDSAWEFMKNVNPDIRQEWLENAKEFEIDEFDAGELLNRVIEDEREYSKY